MWDNGQKAYASSSMPLILGCVGSGFYGAHIAPRVIGYSQAVAGMTEDLAERVERIGSFTYSAIRSAPATYDTSFELVCAMRSTEGAEFRIASILASRSKVEIRHHAIPEKSGIVHASGSGAEYVHRRFEEWRLSRAADTSRAIYSAFCDALLHPTKDPWSEGPPQLVGIYRIGAGRYFATAWRGQCYFGGIPVSDELGDVQCRNELFERCNPNTLQRLKTEKGHKRN
jgi:hypothetical protein